MEPFVYLACIADRHIDPIYRLFLSADEAIGWASDGLRKTVAHPESVSTLEPVPYPYVAIWKYDGEDDGAWVLRIAPPE